jgi:hypothetical protein
MWIVINAVLGYMELQKDRCVLNEFVKLEAIPKIPCRRGSASYERARMQGENARRCIRCNTASTSSPEDDAISWRSEPQPRRFLRWLLETLSIHQLSLNLKRAVAGLKMAHLPKITSSFEFSVLTLTVSGFKALKSSKYFVLLNSYAIFILLNCSI